MAKKKAAKKSILGTLIVFIGVILGIVGILCLATNAVSLSTTLYEGAETSTTELVTGFGLAFGAPYDVHIGDFTYTAEPEMNASVLVFFIVLALGILVSAVGGFMKLLKKKPGTIVTVVGALLLLVGGILFFIVPSVVDPDLLEAVDLFDKGLGLLGGSMQITLGAGSILAAIGGILGGALAGIGAFIKK